VSIFEDSEERNYLSGNGRVSGDSWGPNFKTAEGAYEFVLQSGYESFPVESL
jgi:hypothetical protein